MTLTDIVIQKIIDRLLRGEDYRPEILGLINAVFLQYAIEFFAKVAQAKLKNEGIDGDWYKREFLAATLPTDEIILNAGLNTKTVSNAYKSARKEIVLEIAPLHYDELYTAISQLADQNSEIDITLTIKFRGVSIDLNINESLLVINALAVKRAQIRGGAWSTAGKRVEKYLMLALCQLYQVPESHYMMTGQTAQQREVDFFLISRNNTPHQCEVKLMGKGNPESADAVIARDSQVFIADTLSNTNKSQLDSLGIHWIELRAENGYKKWGQVLRLLDIPYQEFTGDLGSLLPRIFEELFPVMDVETSDILEFDADVDENAPE